MTHNSTHPDRRISIGEQQARRERDQALAERDEARQTIDILNDLYREAVGAPASEHQTRRLEAMAQAAEQAQTERDEALDEVDRLRQKLEEK